MKPVTVARLHAALMRSVRALGLILGLGFAGAALLTASVSASAEANPASNAATPLMAGTPKPATYVGEQVCVRCHAKESDNFAHTTHLKAFKLNPQSATEKQVCETCHGPGSRHLENASDRSALIGFTKEWGTPVAQQNAQCMSCHVGGQRIHWPGSVHARQDLACSDCHNPMAKFSATGLLRNASISETCYSCHQQQRAEFRKRSHMPLPEGKMSCEDCHNPHGSATRPLLKADSVNTLCYSCHTEKRGPFIWEHAPVRESCLNCHTPHGSNQDKLLAVARPQLCQQCHTAVQHPNDLFVANQLPGGNVENINERLIARSCQNCHTQIHGSNSPDGVRFHR